MFKQGRKLLNLKIKIRNSLKICALLPFFLQMPQYDQITIRVLNNVINDYIRMSQYRENCVFIS